jgi:hypothetical protein
VYRPPVILEQPRPRELTQEQCTERINQARNARDYVYVPPECQEQYRQFQDWQRNEEYRKQREAQQQQREQQQADWRAQQQAQQEQRERENAERQRQQRADRTFQGIQGIIRDIKSKRRP